MSDKPSRLSRLPIVVSVVAVSLSLVSTYLGFATQRETRQMAAFKDNYDTFKELDRLQMDRWQLSHLTAAPDEYAHVLALVKAAAPAGAAPRAALALQEEAMADWMFDTFEHALFQYRQAEQSGDPRRVEITQGVVDYFTSHVLNNPRLLYFWTVGGKSKHYDPPVVEYVRQKVLNGKNAPDPKQLDPLGPLVEPAP
jgi:hypothetical protein